MIYKTSSIGKLQNPLRSCEKKNLNRLDNGHQGWGGSRSLCLFGQGRQELVHPGTHICYSCEIVHQLSGYMDWKLSSKTIRGLLILAAIHMQVHNAHYT
jgi:hypothetical protein